MTPIAIPLTRLFASLVVAVALAGCGGSDPAPPPPTEGSATVGAAGGIVTGPDGVRLFLPPGAVETDATFRIARDGSGAPPLPAGIDLASEVYAITPHGSAFGASASVELPVSPALAAGRPTFLMKADPGGRWSVVSTGLAGAGTLRAGIDSLSYLAVGACQNNLPIGSLFGQACPSSNRLSLELLINGTTPVPISQDTTYGAPIPVLLVTTPETLTFRMTWTRPAGTNRVDVLDTGTGYSGTSLVRQAGFTFSTTAPRILDTNENSFSRIFTVDVDPARVSGASGPSGVVRRIWAQASYNVTGPGNVGSANWDFTAWVPIQVRSLAPVVLPVITTQPADVSVSQGQAAGFGVSASITPASTLTYQWSRSTGPGSPFTAIPGATAAGFNIASATLADDGAQFQVQVCAGPTRCVVSSAATLSVVSATSTPTFTTSPIDQRVVAGQTVSLNAVAIGAPLPAIRWQRAPAGSSSFADITGVPACAPTNPGPGAPSVAASCTVGPLDVGDSGQRYRAVATSTAAPGGVTSSVATVTVDAAGVAPAITQQPAPQSTTVGGSATFSVTATGTAPLNYTWRLNGSTVTVPTFTAGSCTGNASISGASLTLSNLSGGCASASIEVVVNNATNPAATSSSALLTVNPVSPWTPQNTGYIDPLVALAVIDSTTAWAAGPGGDVLRTTDGGATWNLRATGVTDLRSISAVDANTAWAVGGEFIVKTTDGGQTWARQGGTAPGWFLYAVSAVNSNIAWAAGFGGDILKTTDGGASWITQVAATGSAESLFSVAAVDASTAWAVGNQRILKTVDGGANWVSQPTTGLSHNQVVAANDRVAWVVINGAVLRTVNGGDTWSEAASLPVAARSLSAIRGNTTMVWALSSVGIGGVGAGSSAHVSTNGGVSWTSETVPGSGVLHQIGAIDGSRAWIVGDRGRILKR